MRTHAKTWGTLIAITTLAMIFTPELSLESLDLGVTLLVYLAIAQAWNVLAGFGGQVSLGSAAFVATGGYASALLLAHTNVSWVVALTASALTSAVLAAILAVPLLRLRGDYFAVGTLAVSIAIQALLTNWTWAGGAGGLTLPVDRVPSGPKLFQVAVIIAALAMGLAIFVKHSKFGLRLAAIRDNEPAAAGLGVSVTWHRFLALVPSSVVIGLAGAVVAYQFVAISPGGVANVAWSLNAVLMAIVGGTGTVLGPAVGVMIVYYGLTKQLESTQTLSQVLEGVLLIVIVRFAPEGIWPLSCRLVARLTRAARGGDGPRPATDDAAAVEPSSPRSPLEVV